MQFLVLGGMLAVEELMIRKETILDRVHATAPLSSDGARSGGVAFGCRRYYVHILSPLGQDRFSRLVPICKRIRSGKVLVKKRYWMNFGLPVYCL